MRSWSKAAARLLVAWAGSPRAEDAAEAIRAALTGWRDDFNAGRTRDLCDLFAADLVVVYQGQPDRDHEAFCRQLQAALADPKIAFGYALEIEEIIVSGDLAVARVSWMLTSTPVGAEPDDLREAASDKQIAIGIHHPLVTRSEPAICKGALIGDGIVLVTRHDDCATNDDFTHLSCGQQGP
jgi:steroid delta-isomerase